MLVPWHICGRCVCGAARFDVEIDLPPPPAGANDPLAKVRRVQEERALGLKSFETFSGERWQVCDRPECLELAKKYDNENHEAWPDMKVTPEINRTIGLLAEAKMHFLLATQGTRPGTTERVEELAVLERLTKETREYVDTTLGGIEKLPHALAVELRVCELGIERLGGAKAPPLTTGTK